MVKVYISYDYELLWGVWDGTKASYVKRNVAQANSVLNAMLETHQKHKVPATFAMVGAMLEDAPAEELFVKTGRGADDHARFVKEFAPHIGMGDILQANKKALDVMSGDDLFELASHTYTHFYALKASPDLIKAEFETFNASFKNAFGRQATSLVMPKNQTTQDVLETAADYGITVIRMNPDSWLYRPVVHTGIKAKLIRVLRYIDTYLPLLEMFPDRMNKVSELHGLKVNKGQYFMRPSLGKGLLDKLHRNRLKLGLLLCRLRKQDCHYWSHPHNFGANPEAAIANLDVLFSWLKKQEQKGRITLHRMDET